MARGSMGKHLAGKVVQGGKEGHRSMAVVIMGLGANVSWASSENIALAAGFRLQDTSFPGK
jgi:hypothetical protein